MKKIKEYLIPVGVIVAMFLLHFIINGIVPFGRNTILIFDMGLQTYPNMVFFNDVAHGLNSIVYNFNYGAGLEMFPGAIMNGLFSPLNWIFFICSRENVVPLLSIATVMKFIFISVASQFAFKRLFPEAEKKDVILATLFYTLSSFTFLYYENFQWIECWGLFPIVMLGIKRIGEGKSSLLYVVSYSILLLISYYIAWLTVLATLFASMLYFWFFVKKENRLRYGARMIVAIILSLLIPFVSFWPALKVSLDSYRVVGNVVVNDVNPIFFKLIHVCGNPVLLYYVVEYFANFKKDKKRATFYAILVTLVFILPMLFDQINRMWHTGSYSGLPYRYGFITIFLACMIMLRSRINGYIDYNVERDEKNVKYGKILMTILFIVLTIFEIVNIAKNEPFMYVAGEYLDSTNFDKTELVLRPFYYGFLILILSSPLRDKKFFNQLIIGLFITSTFYTMQLYMRPLPEYSYNYNESEYSIMTMEQLNENIIKKHDKDEFRFKDHDDTLINSIGLLLEKPTISNWYHFIPKLQVDSIDFMGYNRISTPISDTNGTVLSDYLLGIKYIFNSSSYDERVFNVLDKYLGTFYLEYKDSFPAFAKVIKDGEKFINWHDVVIENKFTGTNYIYKSWFNKDSDIIQTFDDYKLNDITYNEEYKQYDLGKNSSITYNIKIEKDSFLYGYIDSSFSAVIPTATILKDGSLYKELNYIPGKQILELDYLEPGNYEVTLHITPKEEDLAEYMEEENLGEIGFQIEDFCLGAFDYKEFIESVTEYNKNNNTSIEFGKELIKVKALAEEDGEYLFVPYNYSDGWTATVNGKDTKVEEGLGYLMVKLDKGDNEVEFKYHQKYIDLGIKVSLIATIIYILLFIIFNFGKFKDTKIAVVFYFIGTTLYFGLVMALFFAIYVYGFFK